jgi:CheY-like chemotaxis protein
LVPNQPQYRILVVDDRWENRHLLVTWLMPLGFEVREAENGQEAIAVWESWQPHLIWMDLRMPGMDGYEATRRIRELERDALAAGQEVSRVKIIALTASAMPDEQPLVLRAGCDDFERKPCQESALLDKVAAHLGVQYVYTENVTSVEMRSLPSDFELTAASLQVMSGDWIADLHRASMHLDDKQVQQLIADIPPEHALLALALSDLASNFRFDVLMEISLGTSKSC